MDMVDAHDRASRILDLGDLVGRFLTHELPLARILRNVFRDLGGFGFRRFFWEIWVGSELAEPLSKSCRKFRVSDALPDSAPKVNVVTGCDAPILLPK